MSANQKHSSQVTTVNPSMLRCWSAGAMALAFIALALIGAHLLGRGEMVASLEKLNTELPASTIFVLGIPSVLIALACIAAAGGLIVKEFYCRDRGLTLLVNVSVAGVAAAMWAFAQHAMAAPMYVILPWM